MIGWVIRTAFTLGLVASAWWLWNEVPRWLRGTEFSDFSYVASLVLIFVLLSLAEPILKWAFGVISNGTTNKSE